MTVVAAVIDALGMVCSEAIDADNVFAAGVTQEVTDAVPTIYPLADDFSEAGMPACTLALGAWAPVLQPGAERAQIEILGAIWRPRVPLGENTAALYADRDQLVDAFIAHSKAFPAISGVQSAILMGGPGIVPRALPRTGRAGAALFLTLPFTVDVRLLRGVIPLPE